MSSRQPPPEAPVFFLDRSLGKFIVAEALRGAGAEVRVHDDHFPPGALDETWLAEVGEKGWVVLTQDRKIRYRQIELDALRRARVAAFVFTGANLRGEEVAQVFVRITGNS